MKVSSFCFVVISVLLAYLVTTNEGFVFNDQNQNFIGDVNRCSNINPLVDSKTIDLIAYGKWSEGKFCTTLRRDLKVADEQAYEISTEFINLSGINGKGHLGFMFNVWDDFNYDYVYKRLV